MLSNHNEDDPTWKPVKELNLAFDNCGGQNKNRMVLQMLPLLVAKKICLTARAIFLVRGHTKNDCDLLFNLLKTGYHKQNTYIPQDLEVNLNINRDVTAIMVDPSTFLNFDKAQSVALEQPTQIKKNHIFTVKDSDPTILYKQECDGAPEMKQQIVCEWLLNSHWVTQMYCALRVEEGPGIQDIKWVELYKKYGKFIPEDKKRQWKYYNEDPGDKRRRKVQDQSKANKKQRRERSVTTEADLLQPKDTTTG